MGVETLNRQKGRPVSFNGELLAESSTRDDGDNKHRWWSVRICRNDDIGRISVGVGRLTLFSQTERDQYWMDDVDTIDEAYEVIARHVNTLSEAESLIEDLQNKLNGKKKRK